MKTVFFIGTRVWALGKCSPAFSRPACSTEEEERPALRIAR